MMKEIQETDAVSIRAFFADLEDPRSGVNRRHLLEDVIVICILGVLAGADGPKAIATWATAQEEWLGRHLELPHGVPSHDPLGRAWAVRGGISLGQLATSEKSNEITAIPELLEHINVHNTIVTIDAQGCQRAIARDILRGGGDYVLALKGNQAKLFESVQHYVEEIRANAFHDSKTYRRQEVVKGHGRVDTLTYYHL